MIPAPEFAPYPASRAPGYRRWIAGVAGLLILLGGASALLDGVVEPRLMVVGAITTLLAWLLVLLLRVLRYRFNRHNARCYAEAAQRIQRTWWAHHRQKAALVDTVLLGPACLTQEHRQNLLNPDQPAPIPQETPEGLALRLLQVFGDDLTERERQLAVLLALQWCEQQTEPIVLQPVRCYWQGSVDSWAAFVEQMAESCPQVELPERPEPWQGIRSLDSIIDQLQSAPSDARILCGGCQSSSPQKDSRLPAGEAALLWLLGPEQGIGLLRGEWSTDQESVVKVAERAVQQSELQAPAKVCVSFFQPDIVDLSAIGWNTKQNVQDHNFGTLANLEAMVAQTLAAWHAEQHGEPCAWLACDSHYTLALGIVKPHDSNR
ncbi:hypothetical protein M1D68_12015 [Pseudomonas sp. R4-84]